jgi:DNA-binding NarL/FixJ family response regulator
LKNSTPEEIVRAVERVGAGDVVLARGHSTRCCALRRPRTIADPGSLDRLTEREKDVLLG